MKLLTKFEIHKDEFIDAYRVHVKYKFKLQRSMILSVLLFTFGMVMEYAFQLDFNFINNFVFWIMIIAIAMNLTSDYLLPKMAYNNLLSNATNKGEVEMNDEKIIFIYGKIRDEQAWNDYDHCIETDASFLLYKKDIFKVLVKDSFKNEIDEVRNILIEKVNGGNKITVRK